MADHRRQLGKEIPQTKSLDGDEHPEQQPPDNEIPAGAVPQPGSEPDNEQIAPGMRAVPTEGDIQIIPQEAAQRNVPAPPELGDRFGDVWVVEVLNEMEAEHPPETDGHIGITGKVIVDLQRIEHRPEPGAKHSNLGQVTVHIRGQQRTGHIGHRDLFEQTDAESGNTPADVAGTSGSMVDLIGHIGITHDRPRHQLEIHRHIHNKAQKAFLSLDLSAVDIHHIGDGLESVEADTDGKCETRLRQRQAKDGIEILHQKTAVLEDAQQREIDGHRRDQRRLAAPGPGIALHQQPADIHQRSGKEEQQHPHRLPPGIEQEGHRHQYKVAKSIVPGEIVED